MPEQNNDLFLPTTGATSVQFDLVYFGSFTSISKLPIFWGPGQYLTSYPTYVPPDATKWQNFDPLQIPEVGRFMFVGKTAYDSKKYSDASSPPPPPPPPPPDCAHYAYEIQPLWKFVSGRVAGLYHYSWTTTISGNPFMVDGIAFYDIIFVEDATLTVTDPASGINLYVGSVMGASPAYGDLVGARNITFTQTCINGDTETTSVVSTFFFSDRGVYADPTIPPRCWYRVIDFNGVDHGCHSEFPPDTALQAFFGCTVTSGDCT